MHTLARHRSQATTTLATTSALGVKHVQRRMNTVGTPTNISSSSDTATLGGQEWGSQRGGWGAHASTEPQAQAWGGGWGNTASSSSAGGSGGWGAHAAPADNTNTNPTSQAHEGAWGGKSGGSWGAPRRARIEDEEAAIMASAETGGSRPRPEYVHEKAVRHPASTKNSRNEKAMEGTSDEEMEVTGEELEFVDGSGVMDKHGFPETSHHFTGDLEGLDDQHRYLSPDEAEVAKVSGVSFGGPDPFGDRLDIGETTLATDKLKEIHPRSVALESAQRNIREAKSVFDAQVSKERAEATSGFYEKYPKEAFPEDFPTGFSGMMDYSPTFDKVDGSGTSVPPSQNPASSVVEELGLVETAPPVRGRASSLGPLEDKASSALSNGPIDVAARFEPRLAMLPNASVESILALQPHDAVDFAANYISMQHFIRNCRRRRVNFVNGIFLSNLKEEALLSAAIKAVENRTVPIEKATRILRAPFLFERMLKYRRYLSTLVRSWAVEVILNATLSPTAARNLLLVSSHFGKDARIIGSLAQKSIEDVDSLSNNTIIRIMYAVAATHVKPPASFWSVLLRQFTRNMHEANSLGESAEGTRKKDSANGEHQDEEEGSSSTSDLSSSDASKGRGKVSVVLQPREVYRILDCCARVGVFSDINTLTQLSEHAWREIAKKANDANFPEKPVVSSRVAVRRLFTASQLVPHQFFRLIQISSSLGTTFNVGRGAITDKILVPLSHHLNDHHLSEFIESLAVSRVRYAPAIQAAIDRVVVKGRRSPAALMHLSRLLRLISQHNDVCAQLRLAKFFDLLEQVCSQKQTLRTIQMTRIVEDIYFITRRFSRTAPLVVRMQRIVDEFCGTFCIAIKRGVVPIDQVNIVLENTVMLGMSKDTERFPNTHKLRQLRKELYQNTKPGAFPSGYKDKVDPSIRFLYNELVYSNQSQCLFRQPTERSAVTQLEQLITVAGPLNTLQAIFVYNELHGVSMPLSSVLQHKLKTHLKHWLADVKTGMTVAEITKKLGYPRGRTMVERDLRLFGAILTKKSLYNLRYEPWYLEFMNAAVMAFGGVHEDLLQQINEQQAKRVTRRENLKTKKKTAASSQAPASEFFDRSKKKGKPMFSLDQPQE